MHTRLLPGVVATTFAAIAAGVVHGQPFEPAGVQASAGSQARLAKTATPYGPGISLRFDLASDGWANLSTPLTWPFDESAGLQVLVRASRELTLEWKFVQRDGATFGRRARIPATGRAWRRIVLKPRETNHWWGGTGARGEIASVELAVTGVAGVGRIVLVGPTRAKQGERTSADASAETAEADETSDLPPLLPLIQEGPTLDPDCDVPGVGDRQRRAESMAPEDPLVVAWLKQVQDEGSPARRLLPSTPGGDEGQTFNNALAAMAFLRHGEKERAERILDVFRDAAVDRQNADPAAQSFYLRGEARGFFQRVSLHGSGEPSAFHAPPGVDRWMGDMAWLWLAMDDHRSTCSSDRYAAVMAEILGLLRAWYVSNPRGPGGYVQHGWRAGDAKLHEEGGHHEGNIDCSAVFELAGEQELAGEIRRWLASELDGRNDLPLDLYSWRVMSLGGAKAELLAIPECDLRFRKRIHFGDREVVGFYSSCAQDADNIWTEGIAHMACAYAAAGDKQRAAYYANQLDLALVDETIGGASVRGLPYALKSSGDYSWVNTKSGFTSTAAWYILAKQGFNPLAPQRKKSARAANSPRKERKARGRGAPAPADDADGL